MQMSADNFGLVVCRSRTGSSASNWPDSAEMSVAAAQDMPADAALHTLKLEQQSSETFYTLAQHSSETSHTLEQQSNGASHILEQQSNAISHTQPCNTDVTLYQHQAASSSCAAPSRTFADKPYNAAAAASKSVFSKLPPHAAISTDGALAEQSGSILHYSQSRTSVADGDLSAVATQARAVQPTLQAKPHAEQKRGLLTAADVSRHSQALKAAHRACIATQQQMLWAATCSNSDAPLPDISALIIGAGL